MHRVHTIDVIRACIHEYLHDFNLATLNRIVKQRRLFPCLSQRPAPRCYGMWH